MNDLLMLVRSILSLSIGVSDYILLRSLLVNLQGPESKSGARIKAETI
jgi:hypothetical protein